MQPEGHSPGLCAAQLRGTQSHLDLCFKHLIAIAELLSQIPHTSIIRERGVHSHSPHCCLRTKSTSGGCRMLEQPSLPCQGSTHSCWLLPEVAAEPSPPASPRAQLCLRSALTRSFSALPLQPLNQGTVRSHHMAE